MTNPRQQYVQKQPSKRKLPILLKYDKKEVYAGERTLVFMQKLATGCKAHFLHNNCNDDALQKIRPRVYKNILTIKMIQNMHTKYIGGGQKDEKCDKKQNE
jgi:hypothetical protein